jgi:hypothetical protein
MKYNRPWLSIIGLLVLLGAQIAAPAPVYACSCVGPATARQVMEFSDVVFLGRVISIKASTPDVPGDWVPFTGGEVLFEVLTIWKGEPKAQYVVYTGSGMGDCGVSFTVGQIKVVFASDFGGQSLGTGSCSYWRPRGAPPDEVALGPGKQVTGTADPTSTTLPALSTPTTPTTPPAPRGSNEESGGLLVPVAWVIVTVTLVGGLGFLLYRRGSARGVY